jgi:hypothetical protein
MTLALPDDTNRARIVRQIVGCVAAIQLRNVSSAWLIYWTGRDLDLAVPIKRRAGRRGSHTSTVPK